VSDDILRALRKKLNERRFNAGEVIIEAGSTSEQLCLIVQGRVRLTIPTKNGQGNLLALLHEGDFFGELELVDGRPRSSQVVAVDNGTLLTLDKEDFEHLLNDCHPFAVRLLEVSSIRLRALSYHFIRSMERNLDRLSTEINRFGQLIEAAKTVNSSLDLDKLLFIIMDTALAVVNGERGTLYIVDELKQELWSKVLKDAELVEIRLPMGKGIAGYVAATGAVVNIPDAYNDPRFNPEIDKRTGYRTKSILCCPMRNKEGKIIGVLQLLNERAGIFTREDENFITALSVHASVAIENARLYEQEKVFVRMQEEVRLAAKIQLDLLPKRAPQIAGYNIGGKTLPALAVGGDYFDFIGMNDARHAVCIGDVSGKGLPASLLMANVQATVRGQALHAVSPRDCISRSNRLLFQSTDSEKFVTLVYGILDAKSHRFSFSNAGHENPFYFSGGTEPLRLKTGGTLLGIFDDIPFDEDSFAFDPGGVLVMFSDGVTEAMNGHGDQFGEQRLEELLQKHRHDSAQEIIDNVLSAVSSHVGSNPQTDDITLVVIKRLS
jgi:sigma-B regulation protein RsbU (phosphoserine phosphatase)